MASITPERYFFMYAFPCAYSRVLRREIPPEEYERLEELFRQGKAPQRSDLEKIFTDAFSEIRNLAEKMGETPWSLSVIRDYWLVKHNKIIDEGRNGYDKLSESFKELCKVHCAKVLSVHDDFAEVSYSTKKLKVMNTLENLKKGDEVTIHRGAVIEKLPEK